MKLRTIGVIVGIFAASSIHAEEPAELVKLRQQFQGRMNLEMQPLRARYLAELEKLEKALATSGRLEDALVVKQERQKPGNMDEPAKDRDDGANPRNAAELQKVMEGSYWVVFAPNDEKREFMKDVYEFRKDGVFVNLVHPTKKYKWIASAASRIKVDHELGTFDIKIDWNSAKGEVGYSFQEQENVIVLVNRQDQK